jgi:hypothetical protein
MSKRIAMVCIVTLLLGTAAIARDRDDDRYGAIAYSRHTGHYGYWKGAESRAGAERHALEACEGRDCRVEVWFRNSCGALATGEDGRIIGWAHDVRLGEAQEQALQNCRHEGGRRCRVVISACSR